MILDDESQYAVLTLHGCLQVGGSLMEWPPFGMPKMRRMIFKVLSPKLWVNRKIKLVGEFLGPEGRYEAKECYAWLDDLQIFDAKGLEAIQLKWLKQDITEKEKTNAEALAAPMKRKRRPREEDDEEE